MNAFIRTYRNREEGYDARKLDRFAASNWRQLTRVACNELLSVEETHRRASN